MSLVSAVLLAAVVAVLAFVIPAQSDQQHSAQEKSAERALAMLALPAPFTTQDDRGKRVQICVNSPVERCFVAPGDPRDNVAAVGDALARGSSRVSSRCQVSSPLPNSPASCRVTALLRGGGSLVADLFARPAQPERPLATRRYSGSYVQLRVL